MVSMTTKQKCSHAYHNKEMHFSENRNHNINIFKVQWTVRQSSTKTIKFMSFCKTFNCLQWLVKHRSHLSLDIILIVSFSEQSTLIRLNWSSNRRKQTTQLPHTSSPPTIWPIQDEPDCCMPYLTLNFHCKYIVVEADVICDISNSINLKSW